MSKTMVLSPIMAALVKSEDILGKDRKWNAVNRIQTHFLNNVFPKRDELVKFSEKELRSWASRKAAELNEILRKEGFDISLRDFTPEEFGVVSILDVLVEWLVKGERTQLHIGGANYAAVKIKQPIEAMVGGATFTAYIASQHQHPVALLRTKSGDKLFITIADRPAEGFDLINLIDEIRRNLQYSQHHYDYVKFPMVDLNQKVNISWLLSMWTTEDSGQRAWISQALQQTKFKMNEIGARVKSAVAVAITRGISKEEALIIDKPFFLWIEREGISIPLMYAYIDQEDWKDPGNLSNM